MHIEKLISYVDVYKICNIAITVLKYPSYSILDAIPDCTLNVDSASDINVKDGPTSCDTLKPGTDTLETVSKTNVKNGHAP